MSVWRNEEDFMKNMDNTLSDFYITDKNSMSSNKLNIQNQKNNSKFLSKPWYDSDSDDDSSSYGRGRRAGDSFKCPGMEPINALQMMEDIRMQVRSAVGNRYNNDVIEKYYKLGQEFGTEPSTSNQVLQESTSSIRPVQVSAESNSSDAMVENEKTSETNTIESTSKDANNGTSTNWRNHSRSRGKKNYNHNRNYNNRGGSRGPTRYHNKYPHPSRSSDQSFNYSSKNEFPPL